MPVRGTQDVHPIPGLIPNDWASPYGIATCPEPGPDPERKARWSFSPSRNSIGTETWEGPRRTVVSPCVTIVSTGSTEEAARTCRSAAIQSKDGSP